MGNGLTPKGGEAVTADEVQLIDNRMDGLIHVANQISSGLLNHKPFALTQIGR